MYNLENDGVDFGGEVGARLFEVALRNKNGSAIGKEPEVAEERLCDRELESRGKGRIHGVEGIVRGNLAGIKVRLKIGAGRQDLLIGHLGSLRQTAYDWSTLE